MKIVPLKELCQIRHGGTPSKANPDFWRGSIPWVSPKDMKTSALEDATDHISDEAVANSATSLVPEGSILVVARSGILVHSIPVAQAKRQLAFNQDIKALIPNADRVDSDYLFWFVRAQEPQLLAHGVKKGATVHSLQSGAIESLEVPVPSVEEQRRIVDVLSRAEGIVRLRREAQAKAAEIIPALFLDMFGDPTTNPKGWPMIALGEVLRAADYGSSKKASETGAGVPLIRMGNVTYAGDLDLSDIKYVDLVSVDVERYRLRKGDILFNRTNSKELVGKTALWDEDLDAVAASYFIRLRTDERIVRPFYLWAFMNSRHMKRVLFDTARGAIGQANINSKELKAFRFAAPPLGTQSRFEERCRALKAVVAQQSDALRQAKAAFDALLSRVFAASPEAASSVQRVTAVA